MWVVVLEFVFCLAETFRPSADLVSCLPCLGCDGLGLIDRSVAETALDSVKRSTGRWKKLTRRCNNRRGALQCSSRLKAVDLIPVQPRPLKLCAAYSQNHTMYAYTCMWLMAWFNLLLEWKGCIYNWQNLARSSIVRSLDGFLGNWQQERHDSVDVEHSTNNPFIQKFI